MGSSSSSLSLDEDDPISQNYYLEVSSPGLDRVLYEPEHFERFKGRQVQISLYRAEDGKKNFEGALRGLEDGFIIIENEEREELRFPADQVAVTRLAVVF